MTTRRHWLAAAAATAAAWPAGARAASLPEVIAAAKPAVLPFGRLDPLASPRFTFRGTCFVVGDGRLVVTNAHVAPADAEPGPPWALQRPLPGGGTDWRRLELLARDTEHDLALFRLAEGEPLPALRLAAAEEPVREGQSIALIGFPIGGVLGYQPVTHRGIVASVASIAIPAANASLLRGPALQQLRAGGFDVYQLDANAYPGNSGGPVLDADTGAVLAVVNMVLVKGSREAALSHPSGISYAIPVRWVHRLIQLHAR